MPLKAHCFSQSTPIGLDCVGWRRHFSYSSNRKKNQRKQTGLGGPSQEYTPAEELALAKNEGRPIMDGVEGGVASVPGSTSVSKYVQIDGDTLVLVVPEVPSDTVSQAEPVDHGDAETLSVSSEGAVEATTDAVRALYKRSLEQDIKYKALKIQKNRIST
ncbi:hypothetical protein ABVT39_018864 [Epinephelus coioides]